mmetsp:Transcript_30702/g.46509  ORF Transcript_30702/g.46509 Transcript_30702/m.46509 type:complete len:436 (+) Transcript_30702:112-1419(+)|eukprot:CAMPEP_0178918864 /NCGR_PEP_ID=MMETSP0786-20121207/14076_1 /TAXON_ID=186022 /ORGANISM="Thalassionema frauenfeldii, Strain CCMP 1798" /LENGTH=435 /DNA_ID=CAMNT_0020592647 /DNA_START=95 /DNA_END=1402 /DNA_ORIENTATION=-
MVLDTLKALFFKKYVKDVPPGNHLSFTLLRKFAPFFTFKRKGKTVTLVTRASDIREILNQSIIFGNTNRYGMDPAFAPGFFMMARDEHEPEHDHEKSIMMSLLTRDDLPMIRKMAFSLAVENLEEATKNGNNEIDAIAVLSKKVPIQIVDKYFGFQSPDYDTMVRWSDALQGSFFYNKTRNEESPYDDKTAAEVGAEARKYIRDVLLPKRQKELQEKPNLKDPVSRMLRTVFVEEAKFDQERVVANTLGLLVGCVETNNNAILKTLDRLMAMPEAMKLAREAAEVDDDDKLIKICWEVLRWNAPTTLLPRIVTQDTVLNGHKFKKDTTVLPIHRSAFFDPHWVHEPNKLRLDRPYHIESFHFGCGPHKCLGSHVASQVMPMVIKAILLHKPGVDRVRTAVGEFDLKKGTVFVTNYWLQFSDEKIERKPKKLFGIF